MTSIGKTHLPRTKCITNMHHPGSYSFILNNNISFTIQYRWRLYVTV